MDPRSSLSRSAGKVNVLTSVTRHEKANAILLVGSSTNVLENGYAPGKVSFVGPKKVFMTASYVDFSFSHFSMVVRLNAVFSGNFSVWHYFCQVSYCFHDRFIKDPVSARPTAADFSILVLWVNRFSCTSRA